MGWMRMTHCGLKCSLSLVALTLAPIVSTVNRSPAAASSAPGRCSAAAAPTAGTQMGRLYLPAAYQALSADRSRNAGLGPQAQSTSLSQIAERHSAYMASIGNWSDGDPEGSILERVRAAGLQATFAGQNVVTANGASVPEAIARGESFFAQEANGGGPHWANITNPSHHFVGIGIAALGGPGAYTIYLTQVFSDAGGCVALPMQSFAKAATTTAPVHAGTVVHPSVDALQLRTEPNGSVITSLHIRDRLKVLAVRDGWVQVRVLGTGLYGWAFAAFLVAG